MESQTIKQDEQDKSLENASRWLREIELYEKHYEKFVSNAEKCEKRYLGQAGGASDLDATDARFNIYWSNVQTIQPAIYARTPRPVVERRFKDADPVGRLASLILERAITFNVQNINFDEVMKQVRDDRLIVGRGVAWSRIDANYLKDETGQEVVGFFTVALDYIHWSDFGHTPARMWKEVNSVWKRIYKTKDEVVAQFGQEIADKLKYDHSPKELEKKNSFEKQEVVSKAVIYEIWNKPTSKIIWVSKDYKDSVLGITDATPKVKGFFPCPRPFYATLTNSNLRPIADFILYKHLADTLELLTRREHELIEKVKAAAICEPSAAQDLQRLFSSDNLDVCPVKGFAALKGQGGVSGVLEWVPIREMVEALIRLREEKQAVKNDLYELTGHSDIIRGYSNPNETATAQQIKGQFSTLRLSDRQQEMQRFCKDCVALIGEIIAEHCPDDVLLKMAEIESLPEEEKALAPQAIALLRNDAARNFKIEIETDSTIAIDESLEKQAANEYITASGQFLSQAATMIQMMPQLAPVAVEMLKFGIRRYRAGKTLEGVLDTALKQVIEAQNKPPPEPQPDPDMIRAQNEAQIGQMKIEIDQQKAMAKAETQRMAAENKTMVEQYKAQSEIQVQQMKLQYEAELQRAKLQADMAIKQQELQQKAYDLEMKRAQTQIQMLQAASNEKEEPEEQESKEPTIINVNVQNAGRKVVELGPTDPLTGKRVGVVTDIPLT